jgi:hypothetical protein
MEMYLHVGMQLTRSKWSCRFTLGSRLMEMFLQFGYGMMDHCRTLVCEWSGGSVILSPRDLKPTQLVNLASSIRSGGGKILLDPQFYLPYADHERLVSHDYWPKGYDSGGFWSGTELNLLLTKLRDLNTQLGCDRFILPGLFAAPADSDWLDRQQAVFEEAEGLGIDPQSTLATVALGADVVRNLDSIHDILDESAKWKVGGIYLVCEHPSGAYLVEDPIWLANVLDITASFRLRKRDVIIGYCNHQMLIAGCSSATAIASGTWMNVRSFPPDKFRAQYEEEIKKRTTWYYCPHALSEFKIPFLDIAMQQGVLVPMRTDVAMGSTYADILFNGPQPSTVQFSEQAAFRHYLHCLRHQSMQARRPTFDQTVSTHEQLLTDAETILQQLHGVGVSGGHRDFQDMIDVNRAALGVLRLNRGTMLRRYWNAI